MPTGVASKVLLHAAGVAGTATAAVVSIFYPFLPGAHDELAVATSALGQLVGVAGVLLVPIGAFWLLYEFRKQLRLRRHRPYKARALHFAVAAAAVSSMFVSIGLLAALMGVGPSLAVALLVGSGGLALAVAKRLKALTAAEPAAFNPAPLYLLVVPAAALLAQLTFADAAVGFSRTHAIARSQQLIDDIEQYYARNGHYPSSLGALHADYKPSVIGIKQFQYAPNGDAYNLYFEQPTLLLSNFGTREIVMYNKLDQHLMVSHDSDILGWTKEQLQSRRGWYASHDMPIPHWKYFWFD